MRVFFVCGAPKSGTTWLQRILDAHPQICCSGEGHFVERFTLPLAKIVREYNSQVELVGHRVYEGKPYYAPLTQDEYDAMARSFILGRLMARRPDSGVIWIGDKTPRYTQHLKILQRLFADSRFIHIVRDPRDVAMSRFGHAGRAGMSELLHSSSEKREAFLREGANDWLKSVKPVREFIEKNPHSVYTVKYEDLIQDAEREASKVFAFLGVDIDPLLVKRVAERNSFEALTGRKAGEEDLTSFLRKGVAGDWKGRLDDRAVEQIAEVCGPLMREYGYL